MRYVFLIAAIAAAALSFGGSAGATPDPPAKPQEFVDELDITIQRTDAAGNPIGPPLRLHNPQGRPSFVDEQAAKGIGATVPDRTLAGRQRRAGTYWGTPSYSGCAWYHAVLTKKSLLHLTVVFRYHVKRNWCWNYGHRVTSVSTETPWFTDVDPNFQIIDKSISPHGWFYTWCCGDGRSGHYAFRQGRIDNCIFKYGCVGSYYPTIEMFVHGDGTAYIRKDV
jgi:hypothetical protein